MTRVQVIKFLKQAKSEQFCVCIGDCLCGCEDKKEALTVAIKDVYTMNIYGKFLEEELKSLKKKPKRQDE